MTSTSILNDQNREQVQTIAAHAMTNKCLIDFTESELQSLRASVERHEAILRDAERERDRYDREIRALGFHDIGHARTELGKVTSD